MVSAGAGGTFLSIDTKLVSDDSFGSPRSVPPVLEDIGTSDPSLRVEFHGFLPMLLAPQGRTEFEDRTAYAPRRDISGSPRRSSMHSEVFATTNFGVRQLRQFRAGELTQNIEHSWELGDNTNNEVPKQSPPPPPLFLRLCGILPWSTSSSICGSGLQRSPSVYYQWTVLLVTAFAAYGCTAGAFVSDNAACSRASSASEVPLAIGALVCLLAAGTPWGSKTLSDCSILLNAYASQVGVHKHWENLVL